MLGVILEYNKAREDRSRETHEAIEETIHQVCGASNNILDAKLHELYTVLDDVCKWITFFCQPLAS